MKDRNKDRLKIFGTGIVVGGIVAGGGVYASAIGASSVSYSNASSGMSATTAQGAVDLLYKQTKTLQNERNALVDGIYESCLSNTPYSSHSSCDEYANKVFDDCERANPGSKVYYCTSQKTTAEKKCKNAVNSCITKNCGSNRACCEAVMPDIVGCC